MKKYLNKIKNLILNHKYLSIIILVLIIISVSFIYKKISNASENISYATEKVIRGNITATINGSGQVSATNKIDIKTKTSGDIIYVGIKAGQKVNKGALLAKIDSNEAQKTIRDAQISLTSAQLSLQKLQQQNSDENLNADLKRAYDDGFSKVSNAFLDLPTALNNLEELMSEDKLSTNSARIEGKTAEEYLNQAEDAYYKAYRALQKNRNNFRLLNRESENSKIDTIISETHETTKLISDAIKKMHNFVDYLAEETDKPSEYSSYQETLSSETNTIDNHLENLQTIQNDIKDYKDAIPNAGIDIENQKLNVTQKMNTLKDAQENLEDYFIRAPFTGTIASTDLALGDTVSSNTAIASLITEQQMAEISLNEVDVAKVSIGQKAVMTFDAIDDLIINGEVAEVDSVGTVNSGVVNYTIKISFDTQDARVKPGMTTNATITTENKENVLIIPSSAIKNKNKKYYVELLPINSKIIQKTINIGIADDQNTEIISGIEEGEIIIIKTIKKTNTKSSTSTTNNENRKTPTATGILSGQGPGMMR